MAASIVSYFTTKLDTLITEEATLLFGVKEQLSLLQREFEFIESFLRDADRKRRKSHLVEVWVTQIRDIAYDAEDVIDAYILHLEQRKAMNLIKKMFYSWKKVQTLHCIGKEIEQINARARRISTCRSDYNIDVAETSDGTDISYVRRGIPTAEEIYVVGFNTESTRIVNFLKEEVDQRQVICIIGMGGLGKTTLAQKVYKNNDVIRCFEVRVWITVSQEYQERDILLSALKQVSGYQSSGCLETNEELKEELCKKVMNQKYLVIIDDIWKVEAWDHISGVFPRNEKASKVILTTRNQEVALHADPTRGNHLELPLLNEEESLELFCKKVFHVPVAASPLELVKLGKGIVEKCGGLPLAIVVIGGVLMGKRRTPDEWTKVAENVSWYLSQDSNQCRQILTLSYSDLPYYLKPCFLYLGIFPEDTLIPAEVLIRLWVAEGFVDARRQVSMEVVAEDYLEELVQRSLIQVFARYYHGGSVMSFRVHDLRDLAITEGRKDRFIEICNKNDPSTSKARPRRLAIHSRKEELDEFCTSTPPNLRCLFLFHHELPTFSDGKLRVLDVQGEGTWKDIGNGLRNLIFLQYLTIDDSHVTSLPSSIGNLVKLQTLDIQRTSIKVLPKSILKLKNLRHLHLSNECEKLKVCVGMKDFGRNLLTLSVGGPIWMNNDGTGLSEGLVKHGRLLVLSLWGKSIINKVCIMNLKNIFPSTLTELILFHTRIEEDPSDALGSLLTLKVLSIHDLSYTDREMVFCSGRFPQLQFMALYRIDGLCEWRVEDGSIPILRHLFIEDVQKLRKLPSRLRNVTSLQKMEVIGMPQLEERIKENGEDWDTVKHIPYLEVIHTTAIGS